MFYRLTQSYKHLMKLYLLERSVNLLLLLMLYEFKWHIRWWDRTPLPMIGTPLTISIDMSVRLHSWITSCKIYWPFDKVIYQCHTLEISHLRWLPLTLIHFALSVIQNIRLHLIICRYKQFYIYKKFYLYIK